MAANPLIAFRASPKTKAGLHTLAQRCNLSDSALLQKLVELALLQTAGLTESIGGDWRMELAPGGPYFTVSYQDSGVNLPEVETQVYLGSMPLDEDDGHVRTGFLFQRALSYQQHGSWVDLSKEKRAELSAEAAVMFYDEDSVGGIADINGLLVLLAGCVRACGLVLAGITPFPSSVESRCGRAGLLPSIVGPPSSTIPLRYEPQCFAA
jgi:hypothetical protein